MRKLILTVAAAVLVAGAAPAAQASGGSVELLKTDFSWDGLFGRYDRAALKRGYQVFHEVCSNCHGLRLVAYRNLAYVGLNEDQIKEVAAEREVQDGPNDEGQMFMRAGRAADKFISPFANDNAARAANNGALPPDLSLINKARPNGPHYVYSLLQGYEETAPEGHALPEGMYYNKYFPGHNIGMVPPIADDSVTYADGTKATQQQIAHDVVTFLNWAAEPELDDRKSMGLKTLIFLLVLTGLMYALKRQIWKDVH
ncbi:MAG: cytochrome c1 [Magnetospirillum sp.]|nr:cytochrome c1 [Magnetospirillum sp.]